MKLRSSFSNLERSWNIDCCFLRANSVSYSLTLLGTIIHVRDRSELSDSETLGDIDIRLISISKKDSIFYRLGKKGCIAENASFLETAQSPKDQLHHAHSPWSKHPSNVKAGPDAGDSWKSLLKVEL